MAKTYLDIVNIVLQDANEVTLTEGNFINARGLQAFVKEAVNRALMDIVNANQEWEWLKNGIASLPTTVSTTQDVQWYTFKTVDASNPAYYQVDYDTFFMTDGAEINTKLIPMDYDLWHTNRRHIDEDTNSDSTKPIYVIDTGEQNSFGLSPIPDKAYTIKFLTWNQGTELSAALDTLPFTDQHYNVLVSRARYYLWSFKENDTQAQRAAAEYREGLARMIEHLGSPTFTRMRLT